MYIYKYIYIYMKWYRFRWRIYIYIYICTDTDFDDDMGLEKTRFAGMSITLDQPFESVNIMYTSREGGTIDFKEIFAQVCTIGFLLYGTYIYICMKNMVKWMGLVTHTTHIYMSHVTHMTHIYIYIYICTYNTCLYACLHI